MWCSRLGNAFVLFTDAACSAAVPKQVDHRQRRQEIADALWRVVDGSGFGGVSLRHVAAEAGMSMGLVQHYFRTKEQMLLFAMDSVAERVGQRYAAALADLPDPPPSHAAVRALLIQWLPLDQQRRRESHSLFAFLGEGVREGAIGERMRADMAQLQEFVTAQIRSAGTQSDPRRFALLLLAVNDGLAAHVLGGYLAPGEALAALDAHRAPPDYVECSTGFDARLEETHRWPPRSATIARRPAYTNRVTPACAAQRPRSPRPTATSSRYRCTRASPVGRSSTGTRRSA